MDIILKNKKKLIILGLIVIFVGCWFYLTTQLKEAYAIKDEIYEGFYGLYITEESPSVGVGDIVYVDLYLDRYMWDDILVMQFKSTSSEDKFNVYLKDIDIGKPYFIIPDTAIAGETYELKSFYLYTNDDNGFGYGAGPGFFTNENDLNEYDTYVDLGNKKYVSIIEKDIVEQKNISLTNFHFKDISVLTFAKNGVLPGKVLIRLNSSELDSKFNNKNIFVYCYNSEESSLMEVALEVQNIKGYYEFYINHNSTYILSKIKLDNSIVSNDDSFLKINNNYDRNVNDNNSISKLNIIINIERFVL